MYYILYIIYIYIYILCVAHTQNKQLHPHHHPDCMKPFTRFGVTLLKSLGAMITGALDYLLRVTCGKILKAAALSIILEKLDLDETHN